MSKTWLVLAVVLLATLLTGCGSSKPKGYLSPDNLEPAIKAQVDDKLANATDEQLQALKDSGLEAGDRAEEVVCIQQPNSRREFTCKVMMTSGYSESVTVLVSKDGQRYVGE